MAGLDPAMSASICRYAVKTWMPETSPRLSGSS
jgi:hypothetical protein